LDVTLQPGGAELEINVADTFLPIDLPNPTTTIDMTSIEDLPIKGRRFQDFATLTPTSDRPYTAPGVFVKRNAYRNRGFKNIDLRLLKSFPLGEDKRIEFSAEMFNLFNFDNIVYDRTNLIYGPGIDPVSGAVMPARSTFLQLMLPNGQYDPVNNQLGTPFQAQFGLRYFF